ncbi:transcription initiation factor TFIID subunit 13 [Rhizophagus irregularis DAOM 181602=DAOM 197198]|nr:transcription initiation factor TFIID subunit 13 [Rhizophagus irregularis DAOM 181602=DAOM 197198]
MAEYKQRGRPPKGNKGVFTKDLRLLMYGFGDEPDPAPDTVNVMEELVNDYITEMCLKASKVAKDRKILKLQEKLSTLMKLKINKQRKNCSR